MSILWAFRKLTLETFADVLHLLICGCTCVSIVGIHVMLKVCKRCHQAMLLKASFVGCGTEGGGSPRVNEGHTRPIWLLGFLSTLEVMVGGSMRDCRSKEGGGYIGRSPASGATSQRSSRPASERGLW